jgi:hypothetical protein
MANIDVSVLLSDPLFTDTFTLIRRAVTVNAYGETVITETSSPITACVQGIDPEKLSKIATDARLSSGVEVWYNGRFHVDAVGGYSDIIIWNGERYEAISIDENFINYGSNGGWTHATFGIKAVSR